MRVKPAGALDQQEPGDAKIGADAIYREIIRIRALSIHAELSLVVERSGGHHHAWRKHEQSLETPAIERKILDKRAIHHRADRPRPGVQQGGARFHGDRLGGIAERHLEIDFEGILNVKNHIRLNQLLKAGLFDFDVVRTGGEIHQVVFTRAVGRGLVTEICPSADSSDFGIGDQGLGGIGYAAGKGGRSRLRAEKSCERNHQQSGTMGSHRYQLRWVRERCYRSILPIDPYRHPYKAAEINTTFGLPRHSAIVDREANKTAR